MLERSVEVFKYLLVSVFGQARFHFVQEPVLVARLDLSSLPAPPVKSVVPLVCALVAAKRVRAEASTLVPVITQRLRIQSAVT
jgi:hypothetical protein